MGARCKSLWSQFQGTKMGEITKEARELHFHPPLTETSWSCLACSQIPSFEAYRRSSSSEADALQSQIVAWNLRRKFFRIRSLIRPEERTVNWLMTSICGPKETLRKSITSLYQITIPGVWPYLRLSDGKKHQIWAWDRFTNNLCASRGLR